MSKSSTTAGLENAKLILANNASIVMNNEQLSKPVIWIVGGISTEAQGTLEGFGSFISVDKTSKDQIYYFSDEKYATSERVETVEELAATILAGNDAILTDDIEISTKIEILDGKDVTIDLNGKTITSTTTSNGAIENNGTLTLTGNGNIEATKAHVVYNKKGAILKVENGTYDAQGHAKASIYNEGGEVTITDGTFLRSNENGINKVDNGGNSYYNIVNHGNMTINGGIFRQDGHYSSMLENGYSNYNSGNASNGYKAGVNLPEPTLTITG